MQHMAFSNIIDNFVVHLNWTYLFRAAVQAKINSEVVSATVYLKMQFFQQQRTLHATDR